MALQWVTKVFTRKDSNSSSTKLLSSSSNNSDEPAHNSTSSQDHIREPHQVIDMNQEFDPTTGVDPLPPTAPSTAEADGVPRRRPQAQLSSNDSASVSTVTDTGTSGSASSSNNNSGVWAPTPVELGSPLALCYGLNATVPPSIQEDPKAVPVYYPFVFFLYCGAVVATATALFAIPFPHEGLAWKKRGLSISMVFFAVALLLRAIVMVGCIVDISSPWIIALISVVAALLTIVSSCVAWKVVGDNATRHERPHAS